MASSSEESVGEDSCFDGKIEVLPPVLDVSEETKLLLSEFLERLPSELAEHSTDVDLCVRLLRARSKDKDPIGGAIVQLEKLVKFRAEYLPQIDIEQVNRERRMRKAFWCGHDKWGRPVLYVRPSRHDPNISTPADAIMFSVWLFEQKINAELGPEKGVTNFLTVLDLEGAGWSNLDRKGLQELSRILQDIYPERQASAFIINTPWMFKMIWAIVRLFLDETTRSKFHVLGSSYSAKLLQYIDAEELPMQFGGKRMIQWEPVPEPFPLPDDLDLKSG